LKLSQVPDHVKCVLLATCPEDVDADELDALNPDELTFLMFYACSHGATMARMALLRRDGVSVRDIEHAGNPWGDERIELDEPLPALTRPAILTRAGLADCAGEREANRRMCLSPDDIGDYYDAGYYRSEILGARYADLYERELHFGWPVPEYEAWAKTQTVPAPRAKL
jgi:hypothetical protein